MYQFLYRWQQLNRDELSEDYLRQIKLIEVRNNNEDLQPFKYTFINVLTRQYSYIYFYNSLKENLIAELDNFYFQIDSFIANFNDTSENQKKLTFLDIIKIFIEANSNSEIVIPAFCPLKKDQQGIYKINVTGLQPFDVLCNADIAGPGWTTIAQRQKGTVNFLKSWASYKEGFGNFTDDFFIGMEKLHAITTSQNQELYIYLEDFEGNFRHARYDDLMIGSESENYALVKLGLYSGNAGDSLSEHVGLNFSTFDRDNDNGVGNNAIRHLGAWWYGNSTGR